MKVYALNSTSTNTKNLTPETEAPLEGSYFVSAYPPFSCWRKESAKDVEKLLTESNHSQEEVPLGLYVHIPFCTVRCHYCYYLSYANKSDDLIDQYVETLIREVKLYGRFDSVAKRSVKFVYFGGGTPSILSAVQITRLLEGVQRVLPWRSVEEVTFAEAPMLRDFPTAPIPIHRRPPIRFRVANILSRLLSGAKPLISWHHVLFIVVFQQL